MATSLFFAFAAIILICSLLTVTSRRILRAAVYLLFVLVSTSGMYVWLNYHFLAAVQLTVYAGGIVVLIIFSILLTSQLEAKLDSTKWMKILPAAAVSATGLILSLFTLLNADFTASAAETRPSSVEWIGQSMLSTGTNGYILPFEVVSILLLAAMIGAIVIAKKKKVQTQN